MIIEYLNRIDDLNRDATESPVRDSSAVIFGRHQKKEELCPSLKSDMRSENDTKNQLTYFAMIDKKNLGIFGGAGNSPDKNPSLVKNLSGQSKQNQEKLEEAAASPETKKPVFKIHP